MRRCAAGLAVLLALLGLLGPSSTAQEPPALGLDLAGQTAVVAPGGTFGIRLRLDGVPADGSVEVVVHQRVRSRSELAQSMDGDGLRGQAFSNAVALISLVTEADGTRRLDLPLDRVGLRAEGVYPVRVTAQDAAGAPLGSLITHLIVAPEEGDDSPSLGVALVADLGAPTALQPDGSVALDRDAVLELTELADGLTAVPDAPATLAVRPETLEALQASTEPGDPELVARLRSAATGREVLDQPYAAVSPDALADADLLDELTPQLERGRQVLTEVLGAEPTRTVGVAPPDLGAAGLGVLAFAGVQRLVVAEEQVDPLPPGVITFSVAQPFLLASAAERGEPAVVSGVQALATDAVVLERLAMDGSAGLVASRVLAELALLRLEQPSVARSVVLPVGGGTSAATLQAVLEGLDVGRPFDLMGLDAAFDHATPLLDGGDNQVDRTLVRPSTTPTLRSADADAIRAGRSDLDTFVSLLGPDPAPAEPLGRQLLVASAADLPSAERRAHVAVVETAVERVTDGVSTPATFTLTLTAREGTIPLTIRNDSGLPLHVTVRLRSQKLEFPEGDTIDIVLTEEIQRVPIDVETRASGAFPLEIDVTSPDGQRSLSVSRYTVRSTAVAGAGLVLSIGAGLFLVVWWASHWRRTRRSAKLITATRGHPSVTT